MTAPLRRCGYCSAWHASPCGAGCLLSITDPTWEQYAASCDTRPEGGDATEIAAPFTGGAVGEAETPKGHRP